MEKPLRHELKYLITSDSKDFLLEYWRRYLGADPHTRKMALSPVMSQYYDSPDLRFYEEKLDGVGFRNKVRMRCYGFTFVPGQPVFLEIKQRIWDRVYKIRQKMDNFNPGYMDPENWVFDTPEKQAAFRVQLEKYNLRPSARIWYQRQAFQCMVETDVRITFDSVLTALYPGEELTHDIMEDPSRRILPDDQVILEVKATKEIPAWVSDGVFRVGLRQIPVPKYVMGIEKLGINETIPPRVYQ